MDEDESRGRLTPLTATTGSGGPSGCVVVLGAACLSAVVTGLLVNIVATGSVASWWKTLITLTVTVLLVSLPFASWILSGDGRRSAAKVLFGAWLGMLLPTLYVFVRLWTNLQMLG